MAGKFNHITKISQRPRAVFRNSRENVGAPFGRPFIVSISLWFFPIIYLECGLPKAAPTCIIFMFALF